MPLVPGDLHGERGRLQGLRKGRRDEGPSGEVFRRVPPGHASSEELGATVWGGEGFTSEAEAPWGEGPGGTLFPLPPSLLLLGSQVAPPKFL